MWLMLGFFVAFAVKLPAVPVPHLAARRPHRGAHRGQRHPGRPAAQDRRLRHAALRGAALPRRRARVRARGDGAGAWSGILYGAVLAFGQTDLKRLVAYTSVSHLGFVLLGIFAWNDAGAAGRGGHHDLPRRQHRRRCSCWSARCRSASTRATWTAWAACGRPSRAWAARACSSRWPRWGCPGWATSSASSWCCWGRGRVSRALAVLATIGVLLRDALRAAVRAAGVPRAEHARLATARPVASAKAWSLAA